MNAPRVVCLGPVILDVLAHPCAELPPGQLGQRVDQIRMTAAGTGAGTAVDLAKLGADVRLVGCIGEDDVGDFLLSLLRRQRVDTSAVQRTGVAQTSASMLPIRPNGERPAYHVVGANAHLDLEQLDLPELFAGAHHLHVGGPDSMGAFVREGLPRVLEAARAAGCTTSLDLLAARLDNVASWLRAAMAHVDHLLPNDGQLCSLYGTTDLDEAIDAALDDGVGTVGVTLGADGCVVATRQGRERVPAYDVPVVDTTGCGDAFSAAYIVALASGWDVVQAARYGCAAGGLVAGGLGSDAGFADIDDVRALLSPAGDTYASSAGD